MRITVGEIVAACGGKLLCGEMGTVVTSIVADSRQAAKGSLFIPIIGEKTDSHAYINTVFEAGAAATLTQEHSAMDGPGAWIAVDDTIAALQKIARAYRSRFPIPFVGITGSVGKTTTKEMVALALSPKLCVMKNEGNQNSQIGLPLTMFRLSEAHQAAVVEMGMSNFGEMARLAQVAAPDYAVMTNIGISHIEFLKTQENILKEKLHITDRFHEGSVLFLNGDDPRLAALRGKLPFGIVMFGTQPWCEFRAEEIVTTEAGTSFRYISPDGETGKVQLSVLGRHHVLDALAGLAVARQLAVPLNLAAAALESYRPMAMRQQIFHSKGITIIDDSYNSGPDAAKSSLSVLCGFSGGRRAAVLADMLELGDYSEQAHFEVGVYAAEAGVDLLVTIGEQAERIAEGARSITPELPCRVCADNREASEFLKAFLDSGDVVLVKGSRGMKTDEIVKALLQKE